jgi:hypothetical protein
VREGYTKKQDESARKKGGHFKECEGTRDFRVEESSSFNREREREREREVREAR